MSLQELAGPSIHLNLSIREGHGFGFLKSPIVIVAGTNGIFLETEVVPPSPDPSFHIDLVWETDKRSLRRFRASNTPIKLECFILGPNNQRESIGSILLNIKSAQVIVRSSQVNEKWHRLIGVPPEAKALQPELLLSLTIQEPNSLSQPLSYNSWDSSKGAIEHIPPHPDLKSGSTMPKPSPTFHSSSILSPDFKQGYIQLGAENSCMDTFALTLSVRKISEMELLLQNCQGLTSTVNNEKPLQIAFSIMGQTLTTKPFGDKNSHKISQINEDVVLPLRTSLSVLHLYLQENPSATICVLYCGQEVAAAELHIRSLVPTNDVQSFSREFGRESAFTQNCYLVRSTSGSIPIQDGLQPSIEVMTKLALIASPSVSNKISSVLNQSKHNIENSSQLCVSGQLGDDQSSRSESRQSQDTFVVTTQSGPVWVPVAPGLMQPQSSIKKTHAEKNCKLMEHKRSTTINVPTTIKVTLNNVRFDCLPKALKVRFVFECTNSSIITSAYTDLHLTLSQEPIALEDVCAKISSQSLSSIQIHVFEVGADSTASQHFASARICSDAVNLATKEVNCFSLELKGSGSEQNVGSLLATVEEVTDEPAAKYVDSGSFPVLRALSSVALTSKEQRQTQISLNRREPSNEMAPRVFSSIEHTRDDFHGLSALSLQCNHLKPSANQDTVLFSSQTAVTSALPFDSKTAERIVEELEDWKEKQQEIFIAELKKKEAEHIARITEEWTSQTKAQNTELDNKMAECKGLAETLSNAKQDLRERLKSCAMREQGLQKAKEELDHKYSVKFQELTLAAQRLDEGFIMKVSSVESKCSKLQERIKELESENENLHHQLRHKTSIPTPHGDAQMCGLSHGEVSQLLTQVDQLEGKLHASLQSKAYFKEQWGRAVREMNQAKLQFTHSDEQRNGLENLLGKEEEELQNDQRTLEKLRQELAKFKSH